MNHEINAALDGALEASGIDPQSVSGKVRERAIALFERGEEADLVTAYERASMETPLGRQAPAAEYPVPFLRIVKDASPQIARQSSDAVLDAMQGRAVGSLQGVQGRPEGGLPMLSEAGLTPGAASVRNTILSLVDALDAMVLQGRVKPGLLGQYDIRQALIRCAPSSAPSKAKCARSCRTAMTSTRNG